MIRALNFPLPGVDSDGVSSKPISFALNFLPWPFPFPRSASAAAATTVRPTAATSEIRTASLRMLCLPVGLYSTLRPFRGGGFNTVIEVLFHELLDLGRIGATLEPGDRTPALDEHDGRHLLHPEPLRELRLLLDVHALNAQPVSFLSGQLGKEAVHPACGAGSQR